MQEVALAAVAQRSPLADPAKVAPWLHRLAVNKAMLYRRGRGRRLRMMDRQADRVSRGEHPTEQNEPLDWLVRDERNVLIREAVERLPRRDAEILLLKYVENWSYRELADHLGLSSNAVESRLHRARARMRAELEEARVIEVRE